MSSFSQNIWQAEEIKLRNWFILALIILCAIAAAFYQNTNRLLQAADWRTRTHKVLETIQSALIHLTDAETGERGYLIMGDPSYLEPYNEGCQKIADDIKYLDRLIPRHSDQRQRLDNVISLVNERLNQLANIIRIRKEQGIEPATELIRKGAEKRLMDRIRQALAEMSIRESDILESREQLVTMGTRRLLVVLFAGNFISLVVLFLVFIGFKKEIRKRKKIAEDFQESQEQFERLFEFSPDAVAVLSQEAIIQVNHQMEKIFGYTREEFIGMPIGTLIPECFSGQQAASFPQLTGALEFLGKRKDGRRFPADIMLSPFETTQGKQVIAIIRDVTERKQTEQEIHSARVSAENASRAKSEFLATMSHELRTPLNAIIGFSEVLKTQSFGTLNEKQKEYVIDVWESGRYLLALINDILDISKVEAGKMTLELSEFNLKSVLSNCLVMVKERALNREIKISINIDDSIGSIVADERKIKQIIYNLLSNAIKFTPEKGHIGLEAERQGDKEILFSVWDTGVGIEEKDKNKIFQEFTRIDNLYSRQSPGTGLGLILTKRFVGLHGGRIWFESEGANQGTRFSFVLPALLRTQIQSDQPAVEDKKEPFNENRNRARVLLIEDDPKSAKLIAEYLKDFDFALNVATSGEEGLEKARLLKPLFIILDIVLPKKNGWEVLIELKMDPLTKHIPILVTTVVQAHGRGLTLGAVDYLIKPISKNDLDKALEKIPFRLKNRMHPPKILAIDDEAASLILIEAILSPKGFQVLKEQDSSKAIDRIVDERPDLVLLDLVMPELTGFDILVQLRNHSSINTTPVIVVTGKSLTEKEKAFLKNQTENVIEKSSFDKEALLQEIELILKKKNPVPIENKG